MSEIQLEDVLDICADVYNGTTTTNYLKPVGRLGFNPTTRMKYNKIKQNTDIINIKSVA